MSEREREEMSLTTVDRDIIYSTFKLDNIIRDLISLTISHLHSIRFPIFFLHNFKIGLMLFIAVVFFFVVVVVEIFLHLIWCLISFSL